jgi:hypothetical protein
MAKNLQKLKNIFRKIDGRCHICQGRRSSDNHGKNGAKGSENSPNI